jgi:hypothetical protein
LSSSPTFIWHIVQTCIAYNVYHAIHHDGGDTHQSSSSSTSSSAAPAPALEYNSFRSTAAHQQPKPGHFFAGGGGSNVNFSGGDTASISVKNAPSAEVQEEEDREREHSQSDAVFASPLSNGGDRNAVDLRGGSFSGSLASPSSAASSSAVSSAATPLVAHQHQRAVAPNEADFPSYWKYHAITWTMSGSFAFYVLVFSPVSVEVSKQSLNAFWSPPLCMCVFMLFSTRLNLFQTLYPADARLVFFDAVGRPGSLLPPALDYLGPQYLFLLERALAPASHSRRVFDDAVRHCASGTFSGQKQSRMSTNPKHKIAKTRNQFFFGLCNISGIFIAFFCQ